MIVVRRALPSHRTAPQKAPERIDKSTTRVPGGPWEGRPKGRLNAKASSSLRTLFFTSFLPHHHHHFRSHFWSRSNTHCQLCRDFNGHAMEYERGSGAAWPRREERLRAWAKHERLTVATAVAETRDHRAEKWWSNTSHCCTAALNPCASHASLVHIERLTAPPRRTSHRSVIC